MRSVKMKYNEVENFILWNWSDDKDRSKILESLEIYKEEMKSEVLEE